MAGAALAPLQQISPLAQMERGLACPVALHCLEPHQLTERLGLEFENERDDLDEFLGAVVVAGTGRQIG